MNEILEAIEKIRNNKGQAVLATIVAVAGSAYRREGAKMLFLQSGQYKGTLSAGCLEADLGLRAEQAQKDGQPFVFQYDMTAEDDLTWGRGAGCNGIIDVLIEPLNWSAQSPATMYWTQVLDALGEGKTVSTLRRLHKEKGPRAGYLMYDGEAFVNAFGEEVSDTFLTFAKQELVDFHKGKQSSRSLREEDELIYLDRLLPKERMFVFGAGPDAEPMVDLLAKIGFEVTVVDHRPVRLDQALFPTAKRLVDSRPEQAEQRVEVPSGSYALVMTHSFQSDRVWVNFLRAKSLRYLGVLGPRLRTSRLLEVDEVPDDIHSPVGLNIRADGPDEIAVSVAAELIQLRRAQSAG